MFIVKVKQEAPSPPDNKGTLSAAKRPKSDDKVENSSEKDSQLKKPTHVLTLNPQTLRKPTPSRITSVKIIKSDNHFKSVPKPLKRPAFMPINKSSSCTNYVFLAGNCAEEVSPITLKPMLGECSPRGDRLNRGLRQFSVKVCEFVKRRGTTTYNEVAEELVTESLENEMRDGMLNHRIGAIYDQKNIRRRVYDALNVLMAVNIISKEKKEIKWVGMPVSSAEECMKLREEKACLIQRIKEKIDRVEQLCFQQLAFRNLVERNKGLAEESGQLPAASLIQLPFIIISTGNNTVIDCSISQDKTEYIFKFNDVFQVHNDLDVLKKMGLCPRGDECSQEDINRVISAIPQMMVPYVKHMMGIERLPFLDVIDRFAVGPCDDLVNTSLSSDNAYECDDFNDPFLN